MSVDTSLEARTGDRLEVLPVSDAIEVRDVLAAARAAVAEVAAARPAVRRTWLRAVADALEVPETAAALVATADRETGLGEARLTGELARCANQLRFYGDVAAEGSWLGVTIDHATAASADLRRLRVPLGPVGVLGASNFPFGFGVLGNDTGSALAAGCPVVVKAHPAHPSTSRLLADVAIRATSEPPDTLVGRKVGPMAWGVYGKAGSEFARCDPLGPEAVYIGFGPPMEEIEPAVWIARNVPAARVAARGDSGDARCRCPPRARRSRSRSPAPKPRWSAHPRAAHRARTRRRLP